MKVACTVRVGGKDSDYFKVLPIHMRLNKMSDAMRAGILFLFLFLAGVSLYGEKVVD